MNTKYLSQDERHDAKRAARKARKAILQTFSQKELAAWKKSGKGLRVFAETIGKNQPKTPAAGRPKPDGEGDAQA